MDLGAFSISLTVKDLEASRAFYETLGFTTFGGDADQGWLILRNGTATIGLFQGMFERNMLTFNPGWNADAESVPDFMDVREIQRRLKEAGSRWPRRPMRARPVRPASSWSIRTGTPSSSTSTLDRYPVAPRRECPRPRATSRRVRTARSTESGSWSRFGA